MSTPRLPRRVSRRLSVTIIATLVAAVSACGGGGGTDPQAQPQGEDAGQGNFVVTATGLSSSTGTPPSSIKLDIIDRHTGQAVREYDLAASSGRSATWYVSQAYAGTDTLRSRLAGASQLFRVSGQRIYQQDLRGTSPGTPVVISSLTDVCGFTTSTGYLGGTQATRMDGTQGWLAVETAGADLNCLTTSDNRWRLVPFGAPTTHGGVTASDLGVIPLASLRTALNREAVGMLVRTTGAGTNGQVTLAVYDSGLTRKLYDLSVDADHTPTSVDTFRVVRPMPRVAQRQLIQVGMRLYRGSFESGDLQLGPSIYKFQSTSYHESTTDGNLVYLTDGNRVVSIADAGTATVIATLDSAQGDLVSLGYSNGRLVTLQGLGSTMTVRSMGTDGSAPITLVSGPLTVAALRDGQLWTARRPSATSALSTIVRQAVDSPSGTTLATDVLYFARIDSPLTDLTVAGAPDMLMWCQPAAGYFDCGDGMVQTLDLSSNTIRDIGIVPMDTTATDLYLMLNLGPTVSGQPALLLSNQRTQVSGATLNLRKAWMFVPEQADSLKAVTLAP